MASTSRYVFVTAATVLASTVFCSALSAQEQKPVLADVAGFKKMVEPFLQKHCVNCHGPTKKKGDLTLHNLKAEQLASGLTADLWAGVHERLATGDMPPQGEPRPPREELNAVILWIRAELLNAGRGIDLAFPEKGNHVPHDVLFGKASSAAPATPARIWRISPYQYQSHFAALGKARAQGARGGLALPFNLRGGHGVQDYAFLYRIDEATTEQLLINAKAIAQGMLVKQGVKGVPQVLQKILNAPGVPSDAQIEAAVAHACQVILPREATPAEKARYLAFWKKSIERFGNKAGMENGLAVILLNAEALFRLELGSGPPDAHGRVLLAPNEMAAAISYALTDNPPDQSLKQAATAGRLKTKADVEREVRRLFNDAKTDKQRLLRFFQEYFGYPAAPTIFKDENVIAVQKREVLVADTDQLVLHILQKDKDVLRELLTTDQSFVHTTDLRGFHANKGRNPALRHPFGKKNPFSDLYGLDPDDWLEGKPIKMTAGQRAGILTQPSWLLAYSTNDATDAIHRGKWVRERLLGGAIPDTPITVEAKLPDEPTKPLRERMRVTREAFCWKCHQRMDPLGLPFEMFDGWGRHRTTELGKPVDTTGAIVLSADPALEGAVDDAVKMLHKLAKSEHVEQVFVRHAFRFWLGRNETPEDAPTLQAAHRAYRHNGGSMRALVMSLLTSDSFLYRIPPRAEVRNAGKK